MEIHIPMEIIEEILLNLPAKSLGRFSNVSKSWKAIISDEEFIRQHKRRASLPGRERILFSDTPRYLLPASTRRPLSSRSSKPFICPLENVQLLVSCSDMWCLYTPSLSPYILLNPSMGTYKTLPHEFYGRVTVVVGQYYSSFGMGFDSVADDYKIVVALYDMSEVYSLRSNSWRKIDQRFPTTQSFPHKKNAVFVSNALHWMTPDTIIHFDLSTEKYADNFLQLPPFDPWAAGDEVGLSVLRGKLCLYLNYYLPAKRFVLWEMQEYGDEKSWTKIMDTDLSSLISSVEKTIMTPLYRYQNDSMLMKASTEKVGATIFMVYRDEHEIIWRGCDCGSTTGLLYVESLVSPATY